MMSRGPKPSPCPSLSGSDAIVPVIVGGLVYAGACAVLRVEELTQFTGRLGRRLRR